MQLLSNARTLQGHHQEGLLAAERLVGVIGRSYLGLCNLAITEAAMGNCEAARDTLDEILTKLPPAGRGSPAMIGWAYGYLGNTDNALAWMNQAVDRRDPRMLWANTHPWTNPLRTDPRFAELVARMNLGV